MPSIAILKTGKTMPALAARRGDFEDWFIESFELPAESFRVLDATRERGAALRDDPAGYGAIVVTGSHAMVTDREPWSEAAAEWLVEAVASAVPVLGVCYGHQLLAHGLGGEVGDTPGGRESGSLTVRLTAAAREDPLFRGFDEELLLNVSHAQSVLSPPDGAVVLAESPADPHHAIRFGERAWGVQFHPEFDEEIMAAYIAKHGEAIRAAGGDLDALVAACRATPAGRSLLRRFLEIAGLASW